MLGESSEEWGERVVAYVVPSGPIDIESLRAFVSQGLAAYKHPRALYAIDALPRNALGKVQKHRLSNGKVTPE